MKKSNISVLLMDDEPTSPIIQVTVQRLKKEGFNVDLVETMSQAIESYYQRLYDVFVLDIDMSHIPDAQEGDGVKVLKRFISLHNQTRVIMFSGAGTVPDWFEAANAHCFSYAAKDEEDSVGRLITLIRSADDFQQKADSALRKGVCPQKSLLYCKDESLKDTVAAAITKVLGEKWELTIVDSLIAATEELREPSRYGIIVLMQDLFTTHPDVQDKLKEILSFAPKPNVIVGCHGKDEYRPSILYIANLHPFRMINLLQLRWTEQFEEALKSAHSWYGRQEIFEADMEALKRLHIKLPPEALSHWDNYSTEEIEEAHKEYYSNNEPSQEKG